MRGFSIVFRTLPDLVRSQFEKMRGLCRVKQNKKSGHLRTWPEDDFKRCGDFPSFSGHLQIWSEVNFKRCGTFVEENETKIPDISRHGPKIIYKDAGGTFSKGDPLVVRLAVCRRCYLRSFRSLSVVFGISVG